MFINANVTDYQVLIAGLPAGTQYVVLDTNSDGLAQIAQYLQTHKGVNSIALISHGNDAEFEVGSTQITNASLATYSTELAQISAAMSPGGDFLIYGCDVAQQADGQALIQQIAAISHLNVAASTDATGATALGGNWTLEYKVGTVHTALKESASALAQFNELLFDTNTPGHEYYDQAAQDGFSAIGTSQFTLDNVVYTFDQAANTFAYNGDTSPVQPPSVLVDSPDDGVLEINPDGSSALSNVTISLANGHTFNLQQFDLDSFNGDLYIQAHYANGTSSALIQLASASVGGFTGTVQSQLGSAFNNIISFSLVDQNDSGALVPTLDNLFYTDTGPTVTTSTSPVSTAWSSADNGAGTGGAPVAVDAGLTLSDGGSSTARTATVAITNFQTGDVLGFTAQSGITGTFDPTTGTLSLTTGTGTATIAQWQAALDSVTYSSSLTSPNLSTTSRTVSFSFNDGTFPSNTAMRTVTVTATDQTPVLTEGGATSTNYLGGSGAAAIDANLRVSDGDNTSLATGTVTIASGGQSGDTLAFVNSNATLYGDIQPSGSGSALTLTSASDTATLAQWQAAFDAVTFSAGAGTVSGTRDITFTVSDGTKTSAAVHHSVVVSVGPTVATDGGSASFVTGDNTASTPVAVDAGVTIRDGNSTTLASATIQITGNLQAGHDQLLFSNNPATMGDISAAYDTSSGLLTLTSASGTASLAQWQAAMRSVTFTSDLVVPSNATRTLTFQIKDGTQSSPLSTRTLTVTDTDQTPILGSGGNTVSFTAGNNVTSTPVVVNSAITVADADGGPIHTGTITISGNYEATDSLQFTANATLYGDISGAYGGGTLTLTGSTATLAQWQAALRSIAYTSTAVTPSNLSRTVTFTVNDGSKTSAASSTTVNVSDVDQTPLISGSSGTVTLTQGDNTNSTPVTVDNGIVVSDRDNTTLVSATVSIGGYDGASGDALLFVANPSTMGNISGTYSNGVLTLTVTGTGTLAQWQAALRSVQFQNFSSVPSTTPRVISFVINDGTVNSTAWTRTVNVVLTDQTPLLATSGGTTTFTSGDNATSTPVAVDTSITLTDSDSATMASATVSITGNYQQGEDVLALGSGSFGDITASFDANAGTLTLTSAGASTTAQWVAALRSVTYTDTAVTPNGVSRTISFAVSDGTKTSVTGTKAISVVATHQTPVLSAGATTSQNYLPGQSAQTIDTSLALSDLNVGSPSSLVSLTITVQINSGFQNGDILAFSGLGSVPTNGISPSYDPATGTLTITSTGGTLAQWQSVLDNLQFQTGSTAPLGTRAISITISDGVKTSPTANYTINVLSSAPTLVTTSTGSASFASGDNAVSTPVTIDPNLTAADPLGNVLDTGIVAITGNLHSSEDVLGFVNDGLTMGDISASFNSLTGVLIMTSSSGTATNAQWTAALQAVTYTDTALTPNTATRTISISLSAGAQTSNSLTRTVTVTATDQTPVVTASGGITAYVEGDNVVNTVVIDGGITVADQDNATLVSATVSITTGFQAGEDQLAFNNHNDTVTFGNIAGSYNATTGVMTLNSANGTATLAQWQAALRAVTYSDSQLAGPSTTTRVISFAVNDGTKVSALASKSVSVASTDQTPIVTPSSAPTNFVSSDNATSAPVVIDSGLTVSDRDNATLVSGTVSITGGFRAGQDTLAFGGGNTVRFGNIAGAYNAATGVLTLTSAGGTATVAQWQAALDSITYSNSAAVPDTTQRSISFVVNDGSKNSAAVTHTVAVVATPQTPVLGGSGASVTLGANGAASVAVNPGITLTDRSNAPLTSATIAITNGFEIGVDTLSFANTSNIAGSYNASTGVLTLTSSDPNVTAAQWQAALNSVFYGESAGAVAGGTRTLSFTVSDGQRTSAAVTRSVLVSARTTLAPEVMAVQEVQSASPNSVINNVSTVSSPLIVLQRTNAPIGLSPFTPIATSTFTSDSSNSLGQTSVSHAPSADPGAQPSVTPQSINTPPATVISLPVERVNTPAGADISILVMNPSSGNASGVVGPVSIRQADGQALPSWVRFNAATGVLSGTPPAGSPRVLRFVVEERDNAGHVTRREVVIDLGADRAAAAVPPAPARPAAPVRAPAAPHAAAPVAKPSLAAQLARLRRDLHVG